MVNHQVTATARKRAVTAMILAGALLAAGAALPASAAAETQACLDCHDEVGAGLDGGPHAVRQDPTSSVDLRVSCTSCHGGDITTHMDDPEAVHPTLAAGDVAATCTTCHTGAHPQNQATLSPHAGAGVTCLDCHAVHGDQRPWLLRDDEPELCFSCHAEQRADFAKPYQHPVGHDRAVKCSDCHLQKDDGMAVLSLQGSNAACVTCHTEFQGPFPYEHQATLDYSTEEGGCVNCHEPHGSYYPRLLNQPYEAPHYQVCTQCHMIPPLHKYNTFHGDDWADLSCAECHVDIHGSYANRLFLSTALEGQGCFAAGCHSR